MPKVLISCGELSGDEYGAELAKALKRQIPDLQLKAMGGRNLGSAGVELIVDSEKSASVIGIGELFGSFGKVFNAYSNMKRALREWHPDLLIVIDYPDFNMRLARYARKRGIPVLYYIAPKVWAWRAWRTRCLARDTKRVVAIFPFEEKFLRDRGCQQASFLGNPLLERYRTWGKTWMGRDAFLSELGLAPDRPILTVFPGSRRSEIHRHLTLIADAMRLFSNRHPEFQLVINVAPSFDTAKIKEVIATDLNIHVVKCDSFSILTASDIGLLKSGTSNLQAAVAGLPFVMFYIASPITAFFIKLFVRLSDFSLVNILRPNTIKEITQEGVNPQNLASELEKLWNNKEQLADMKQAFLSIKASLDYNGTKSVSENVGSLAKELLDGGV